MMTANTIFMTRVGEQNVKFGHPKLIKLPNIVKLTNLIDVAEELVYQSVSQEINNKVKVCVVNDAGDCCSRCSGSEGCPGCDLVSLQDAQGEVILKPADNLAVIVEDLDKNLIEQFNKTYQDISMESERVKPELDLTDCLDAFSSRELLDQANPWFCPMCRKNQTASRTLSVWRYPDFLVVHLKRFVYLEHGPGGQAGSVKLDKKVNFPIDEIDLTPYLSGPLQQGGELFDLYGAVCHYGSASGEEINFKGYEY